MPKPARIAALLLLAPTGWLAAACVAGAPDEAIGVAVERVLPGACADACRAVQTGDCDWQSQCDQDYAGAAMGPLAALCGHKFLQCDSAEHAAADGVYGLSYCWRACEGLRSN